MEGQELCRQLRSFPPTAPGLRRCPRGASPRGGGPTSARRPVCLYMTSAGRKAGAGACLHPLGGWMWGHWRCHLEPHCLGWGGGGQGPVLSLLKSQDPTVPSISMSLCPWVSLSLPLGLYVSLSVSLCLCVSRSLSSLPLLVPLNARRSLTSVGGTSAPLEGSQARGKRREFMNLPKALAGRRH